MSDLFEGIIPNISDYYSNYNTASRTAKAYSDAAAADSTDSTDGAKKTDNWWMLPDTPASEDTKKSNTDLTFEDMLLLMVTQLQNQTIDNQADTNDMMNQLIQMTVMQALTEMSTQVEDLTNANIMSYSASLVGKEVTVGVLDNKGNLAQEIVGTVTATGTYNGQQVIFIGDQYFPLSSIMAVGRLPDEAVEGGTKPAPKPDESDKVEGGEDTPGTGEDSGETGDTGAVEDNGAAQEPQLPVEDIE